MYHPHGQVSAEKTIRVVDVTYHTCRMAQQKYSSVPPATGIALLLRISYVRSLFVGFTMSAKAKKSRLLRARYCGCSVGTSSRKKRT